VTVQSDSYALRPANIGPKDGGMARLYLLGFTQDLKGLVFGTRSDAKKATYWVPVDDEFADAVRKLQRAQRVGRPSASKGGRSEGEGSKTLVPAVGRSPAGGGMSAREIQQLLRAGRSVKSVAEVAETPLAWVERLAEPVAEERLGVVRLAQRAYLNRPRLGRSGRPVGEAVVLNLAERKATPETMDSLDDSWDARITKAGTWKVSLRFHHRGKRRSADWDFRKSTREISARNQLANQLGWWPSEEEPEEPYDDYEEDDEAGGE
jgi:hypothetical protein